MDILAVVDREEVLGELGLPKGGMRLIDAEEQRAVGRLAATYTPLMATGGSAGNAMLALAHLGARPGFIGRIGRDEMGKRLRSYYKKVGIEARLSEGDEPTGVAHTFITPDGERTFATFLGAALGMTSEDVPETIFEGYDILHIEGYLVENHELIETVARRAKQRGMTTSLDLASYNIVKADLPFFRHLITRYIDIVFANEEESAAFTEGKAPEEALEEMATMCQTAVVKRGSKGSMGRQGKETAAIEAERVDHIVDTTAAGDFFAGGFLYAYSRASSLENCLRTGGLMASKVIQVVGTQIEEM